MSSHLNAILGQTGLHRKQLPGTHVRVVGLLEGLLQLLQLAAGEDRPAVAALVLLLAPGAGTAGPHKDIAGVGGQQAGGVASRASGSSQESGCLRVVGGVGVHMGMGVGVSMGGMGMMGVVGGGCRCGVMMGCCCRGRSMLVGRQGGVVGVAPAGRGAAAGIPGARTRGAGAPRPSRSTSRAGAHSRGRASGGRASVAARRRSHQVAQAISAGLAGAASGSSRSSGSSAHRSGPVSGRVAGLAGRLLVPAGVRQAAGIVLATGGCLFCGRKDTAED